jgi:hypothetical protein
MTEKTKEITIEPAKYGNGFTVYEWGTYGESSVLAGQTKKQYLDGFDTIEEAKEAYPEADVTGVQSAYNTFDHLPDEDGNIGPSPHDMDYGTHPSQQDW